MPGAASHPAARLLGPRPRLVAGLMSGTSLDGVDAAVVRAEGTGRALRLETLAFVSQPFEAPLREALAACTEPATSDVRLLARAHTRLAHALADAVEAACAAAGLEPGALDLVGSHGQTVQHLPTAELFAGAPTRATLQIGCPATLAARLGVPVVADFRTADLALGGHGAPLAPYLDDALFADARETRGLLNLGGIANLTVLPAGAGPEAAYAFDTGPANMVSDALARRFFGVPYDAGGARAARGTPDEALLERLLAAPFFGTPPPRSTGREAFGASFVEALAEALPNRPHDLLATALELTARTVADAVRRFARPTPARIIASGGGVHNAALMRRLGALLAPVPIETTAAYGLDPDAKEAVLFAVLAHAWADGVRTGLPAVTGAARPAFQGALYLP
ncbi:MAG: anhydro-N-acetylmuramic acid kinase [Rubricoccaceae bacterium]